MSSYLTTAQLEAMRKARIKNELLVGIKHLSVQLSMEYKNDVECYKCSNMVSTIFVEDQGVSGYDDDNEVDISSIQRDDDIKIDHEELDFSDLLQTIHKESSLETELNDWIKKADCRVILRKKDEEDRIRLLSILSEVVQDNSLDIEDKIKNVKMRVEAYLNSSYTPTQAEQQAISEEYFEYVALCQMLDVTPREKYPYRIHLEIDRMKAVLEKRANDEYIMETIHEIMSDLGCSNAEDAILDHVIGSKFKVDGHEVCDVFVGRDGAGIMFEPIVDASDKNVSNTERKSDIEHVCSLYKEIEDRAFERGILLNRVYLEPLSVQDCCTEEKVTSAKKKKKKSISQKLKMIGQED